jgi:hypothetical protein
MKYKIFMILFFIFLASVNVYSITSVTDLYITIGNCRFNGTGFYCGEVNILNDYYNKTEIAILNQSKGATGTCPTGQVIQNITNYSVQCVADQTGTGGSSGVNYWQTLGTTLTPNSTATGGIYKLNASLGCGNITGATSNLCTLVDTDTNSYNSSADIWRICYNGTLPQTDTNTYNSSADIWKIVNNGTITDYVNNANTSVISYVNGFTYMTFSNYLGNQSVNNQSLLSYMINFATVSNLQGNMSNITTWGLNTFQLKTDTVTNISNFATNTNVQNNATALLTNGTLQTTSNLVTNFTLYQTRIDLVTNLSLYQLKTDLVTNLSSYLKNNTDLNISDLIVVSNSTLANMTIWNNGSGICFGVC